MSAMQPISSSQGGQEFQGRLEPAKVMSTFLINLEKQLTNGNLDGFGTLCQLEGVLLDEVIGGAERVVLQYGVECLLKQNRISGFTRPDYISELGNSYIPTIFESAKFWREFTKDVSTDLIQYFDRAITLKSSDDSHKISASQIYLAAAKKLSEIRKESSDRDKLADAKVEFQLLAARLKEHEFEVRGAARRESACRSSDPGHVEDAHNCQLAAIEAQSLYSVSMGLSSISQGRIVSEGWSQLCLLCSTRSHMNNSNLGPQVELAEYCAGVLRKIVQKPGADETAYSLTAILLGGYDRVPTVEVLSSKFGEVAQIARAIMSKRGSKQVEYQDILIGILLSQIKPEALVGFGEFNPEKAVQLKVERYQEALGAFSSLRTNGFPLPGQLEIAKMCQIQRDVNLMAITYLRYADALKKFGQASYSAPEGVEPLSLVACSMIELAGGIDSFVDQDVTGFTMALEILGHTNYGDQAANYAEAAALYASAVRRGVSVKDFEPALTRLEPYTHEVATRYPHSDIDGVGLAIFLATNEFHPFLLLEHPTTAKAPRRRAVTPVQAPPLPSAPSPSWRERSSGMSYNVGRDVRWDGTLNMSPEAFMFVRMH